MISISSHPGRAVTGHAVRQVRRGGVIVALAAAGMSAVVAGQYQSTFAGALDGSALRALAENPAIRILFGPPVALDDPGGFTVWRTAIPVQVLCAVWALLAATRLTRGEEETGRADLLLAGRLHRADLTIRGLLAVTAAAVVIAAAVAGALIVTGTATAGALIHAGGILGITLTFACGGALAAQVVPSRAAATGLTVAVLGATALARMLADGVGQLAWLGWLTPFGLVARAAPYADDRVGPLLVLAAFPAVLTAATMVAARHRDTGGALLATAASRRPRTRLLGSLTAFAVRKALRPTAGWAAGLAAYFLLVGTLITSILAFLDENSRFTDLAAGAGFTRLGTADGFAAAMFSLLAIPTGLYAVTRIAAMVADETSGRSTWLTVLPVSRHRLAASELAVTAAALFTLLTTAGLALWAGARINAAPLDILSSLGGAWNVAPVALLSFGAATLALGWAPRAAAAIGALPVAGGFLLHVTVQSMDASGWLSALSPFAHLAAVPDTPPDWPATTALAVIAALLTAAGLVGYARRDLTA
ncbi:polyketide antibiotic transporter [Amycolatopsis suaedae]|uniref:Polyketide antibiotic transporter n=1 Tax=Amycolatopsis suaedae TaxID=2510978 RepID=A0A4Q7JC36_9PSEU|nr:polyketide antibiotic transporter [Amycolatopsis suaedae]RZQ64582.1 polyketide antibiotic transporter [Amycolatopsis suaedae]